MRILLLCQKPPWPPVDGGTFATWQMACGLAEEGHAVTILAIATGKHPSSGAVPPGGVVQECVALDTTPRAAGAALNLLSSRPYPLARFASGELEARIAARRGAIDLAQLEGLPLALYLRDLRRLDVPVVMRVHNVEHDIWRARATRTTGPLRYWLALQARRMRAFEERAWDACDGLLPISPEVAEACARATRRPQLMATVCSDVPDAAPPLPEAPCPLLHLGALDWAPNADGLGWFLDAVWPLVRTAAPEATLDVAGRQSEAFVRARPAPGVRAWGVVEDTTARLRAHRIVVAPVRYGSGVRVKIVEALAQGRAVVTTPEGAAGLPGLAADALAIGTSPSTMADAILGLLRSDAAVRALGAAAWEHASRGHRRRALMPRVSRFYHGLAGGPSAEHP